MNVDFLTFFTNLANILSANPTDTLMIRQGGTLKEIAFGDIIAQMSSDATTLGGFGPSQSAVANKVAVRDANGDIAGDILGDAATVGGFTPSQTPGANNVVVLDANGNYTTPNGGLTFWPANSAGNSTAPQSYPHGITTHEATPAGGWPASYGQVTVFRRNNRVDQYLIPAGGTTAYRRSAITDANTWGAWVTQWDSGNDGAGSGLDADTLDTLHASAFLQVASFPTFGSGSTTDKAPGGMMFKVGTLPTSGTYVAYASAFPTATKLVIIQRGIGPGAPQTFGSELFVGAGNTNYPAPTAAGFYADLPSGVSASQPATYLAIGY